MQEVPDLADTLAARTRGLPDERVAQLLRPLLNQHGITWLVEYVAERLHQDEGERELHFHLSGGYLRRTALPQGPIGNQELEYLARVA